MTESQVSPHPRRLARVCSCGGWAASGSRSRSRKGLLNPRLHGGTHHPCCILWAEARHNAAQIQEGKMHPTPSWRELTSRLKGLRVCREG